MASTTDINYSNLKKILFPSARITKEEVIDYHDRIASYMLPHLKGRPVTMRRFPDGIENGGFYQKEVADYFPSWIDTKRVEREEDSPAEMLLLEKKEAILYIANQASIENHIFLSRGNNLKKPDKLLFDLDPPSNEFELAAKAAEALRDIIDREENLSSYLMTTGSSGLHVVVPIKPEHSFDKVREYAQDIGNRLARKYESDFTMEIRKNKRRGRLFLDTTRNAYGQHSIAPYSLRAIENAPVATPIDWEELNQLEHGSRSYHLKNIFKRISQKTDPWVDFNEKRQSLSR